jgi:hypothetical protein
MFSSIGNLFRSKKDKKPKEAEVDTTTKSEKSGISEQDTNDKTQNCSNLSIPNYFEQQQDVVIWEPNMYEKYYLEQLKSWW